MFLNLLLLSRGAHDEAVHEADSPRPGRHRVLVGQGVARQRQAHVRGAVYEKKLGGKKKK